MKTSPQTKGVWVGGVKLASPTRTHTHTHMHNTHTIVRSVLGFAVGLIFRLCVCALWGDGSDSKDNNNDNNNAGGTELEPVHSTDNPVFGE